MQLHRGGSLDPSVLFLCPDLEKHLSKYHVFGKCIFFQYFLTQTVTSVNMLTSKAIYQYTLKENPNSIKEDQPSLSHEVAFLLASLLQLSVSEIHGCYPGSQSHIYFVFKKLSKRTENGLPVNISTAVCGKWHIVVCIQIQAIVQQTK